MAENTPEANLQVVTGTANDFRSPKDVETPLASPSKEVSQTGSKCEVIIP